MVFNIPLFFYSEITINKILNVPVIYDGNYNVFL